MCSNNWSPDARYASGRVPFCMPRDARLHIALQTRRRSHWHRARAARARDRCMRSCGLSMVVACIDEPAGCTIELVGTAPCSGARRREHACSTWEEYVLRMHQQGARDDTASARRQQHRPRARPFGTRRVSFQFGAQFPTAGHTRRDRECAWALRPRGASRSACDAIPRARGLGGAGTSPHYSWWDDWRAPGDDAGVLTTHSARPPVGAAAKPRTPAVPHWSRCTAGLVHTRGPVLPEHEGCSMRVVRDRVGGDSTNDLPPNRSRPARPGLDHERCRIIWHNTTTMHAWPGHPSATSPPANKRTASVCPAAPPWPTPN
jgi:hypothetical protein